MGIVEERNEGIEFVEMSTIVSIKKSYITISILLGLSSAYHGVRSKLDRLTEGT